MDNAPTIQGPRHAIMTGAVLGLLVKAHEEKLIRLRPQAVMDSDGNYTNRLELHDGEDDSLVFVITVDEAP